MTDFNRREVLLALPALAASSSMQAQAPASESPAPSTAAAPLAGAGTMGAARVIPFDQMPLRPSTNGGESRSIAHGTLATGESVNLHQSMQPAGATPSPLHVIQHTEFVLIREGDIEFQHEVAGQVVAEKVGPGGVIYVAFGTKHALKNVGTVPARYFVVAIGGDAK